MKTLLIAGLLFATATLSGQTIVLNPTDDLAACEVIALGQTVDFERGIDCTVDVVILDVDDIEVFRSSDQFFSYTFNTPGQFTIYCGAGAGAIAMQAICVEVGIIPTLSEWGIICLGLILLIFAVVVLKEMEPSPTFS